MATYDAVRLVSAEAGSDVTIYRLVTLATDGAVDHVADETERPLGVSAETVSQGGTLPVALPDGALVKLEAGAAITVGSTVMAAGDGSGKVITATSGVGTFTCGTAVEAATADGTIITVQFSLDLDQVA